MGAAHMADDLLKILAKADAEGALARLFGLTNIEAYRWVSLIEEALEEGMTSQDLRGLALMGWSGDEKVD